MLLARALSNPGSSISPIIKIIYNSKLFNIFIYIKLYLYNK